HQGRLDEAAGAFERTIEVDPEYVIACYHLGLIRERQKRIDDAIGCFEKVVEASPGDASAHYHLGLCYEHQGRAGLATISLPRALELAPLDAAAAAALQALQRQPSPDDSTSSTGSRTPRGTKRASSSIPGMPAATVIQKNVRQPKPYAR